MNIGIFVNKKSGRNKAELLARTSRGLLDQRGHVTSVCSPEDAAEPARFQAFIEPLNRLLIVGGDGTVHHLLPELINRELPFFHLATGTSNLISKELRMPKSPAAAVDWIEQGGTKQLDVPTIDGVPFLIMCSFGIDAEVIHQFERSRTKSGGFRNYVIPVLNTYFKPKHADVLISTDGSNTERIQSMNITVANMRSFALGINPCKDASPSDRQLDLLALRCTNSITWTFSNWMCMLRLDPLWSRRATCQKLRITGGDTPTPVQVDGEIARTAHIKDGMLDPGATIELCVGLHHVHSITTPDSVP